MIRFTKFLSHRLHVFVALVPAQYLRDNEAAVRHGRDPAHAHVVQIDVRKVAVFPVTYGKTDEEALPVTGKHGRVVYLCPAVQGVLRVDLHRLG